MQLTSLARAALWELVEAERNTRKERDVAPLETKLVDALADYWDEQRRTIHQFARRYLGPMFREDEASELFDVVAEYAADNLAQHATEVARDAAVRGHRSFVADVGVAAYAMTFDAMHPVAVEYLSNYGARLVSNIDATTQNQMRRILAQGVADGWSYARVAGEIDSMFTGFSAPSPLGHIRNRAELVAVTEIGEAYEVGRMVGAQQIAELGLRMEKSWLAVGDDRVDPDCDENAQAGWIPLDEPFPSGDMHPLAHPGCRCDMLTRMVR